MSRDAAEMAQQQAMQMAAKRAAGRTRRDDPELDTAREVSRDVADQGVESAGADPPDEYARKPNETRTESLERHARIQPVHGRYTLDPTTTPWDIARMAGYGDGAADAMRGPEELVRGNMDAMAELETPSWTEGGPLDLAPDETMFQDDQGHGDMMGPNDDFDWTKEL